MRKVFAIISISILFSCSDTPTIQGFNQQTWKEDMDGCNGNRLQLVDTLLAQKGSLKGLTQNEMANILGKADQHELYERSQKFFIYHLEPGIKCKGFNGNYFKALYIRFNSLNQAVAFTIQEIK